ncbi:MAG: GNAT family N-acetyltransferase [Lachnospiraceae bacterium]|nr:GNAT family N-acetyltransferase [Lachnospiraceae bacterium]
MICLASEADMPQLYRNWENVFGDTREEIERFFETVGNKVQVYVLKRGEQVAGQLCLLPVQLCYTEGGMTKIKQAAYIYAVATSPACRKQGICTQMLKEIKQILADKGMCGVLVPAGKELSVFYEKRGYQSCFEEQKVRIQITENIGDAGVIKECDADTYIAFRNKAFGDVRGVQEPPEMVHYAVESFLKEGGQCLTFAYNKKAYGILYKAPAQIRELTAADEEEAVAVSKAFLQAMGKTEGILQRSFKTLGINLPKGIDKKGCFNLVLE